MANKTIDQLTAAAAVIATQEFEAYDPAGSPKSQKVTGAQIKTFCGAAALTVTDFGTVFGSLPSAPNTSYNYTNTTGHVLLVTFNFDLDFTSGGSEFCQVLVNGVVVTTGGAVDGAPLSDRWSINLVFIVPIGGALQMNFADDSGSGFVFGPTTQVLLF